jgi:hypothetical protein
LGGIDKFLDVSINEVGPLLKMEPVDYDEDDAVGYDDYYDNDDEADQDYTGSPQLTNPESILPIFFLRKTKIFSVFLC